MVTQLLRPRAEGGAAGAARHPEGAGADARSGASRSRKRGRCRRWSSPTTSPTTATRTPIRCTSPSKILSDGQSARIPRELVYNKRLALTAFGSGNIIEDPNLFYAVAIVQPGSRREAVGAGADRRVREAEARAGHRPASCSASKNQFARDYIVGRESNQDKALAPGARRRHPQRHHDRRRRVRHLHERHDGRRAARGQDLLQRHQPGRAAHRCRRAGSR